MSRALSYIIRGSKFFLYILLGPFDRIAAWWFTSSNTRQWKVNSQLKGPIRMDHLPAELRSEFKKNFKMPISWNTRHRYAEDGRNNCSQDQIPDLCKEYMPFVNDNYERKWPREMIERMIVMASEEGDFSCGDYPFSVPQFYDGLKGLVLKEKSALVLGSISPWIEAILIARGVGKVYTVDYETIECDHPKITTFNRLKDRDIPDMEFDIVCSFSSIEHAGLGRYGDYIDPEGDLKALNEVYDFLKPGGLALIGVPVTSENIIESNKHRLYNKNYLIEVLFEKFRVKKEIPFPIVAAHDPASSINWQNQPLFVLVKEG